MYCSICWRHWRLVASLAGAPLHFRSTSAQTCRVHEQYGVPQGLSPRHVLLQGVPWHVVAATCTMRGPEASNSCGRTSCAGQKWQLTCCISGSVDHNNQLGALRQPMRVHTVQGLCSATALGLASLTCYLQAGS